MESQNQKTSQLSRDISPVDFEMTGEENLGDATLRKTCDVNEEQHTALDKPPEQTALDQAKEEK